MAKTPRMVTTGGFLQGLQIELASRYPVTEGDAPLDTAAWVLRDNIMLDRGPFSFDGHEYLIEPYTTHHLNMWEMKSAQMGNTTCGYFKNFYIARFGIPWDLAMADMEGRPRPDKVTEWRRAVGIMTIFPSAKGVTDFVRTRINPVVELNPDSIGRYLQDTDNTSIKRMLGCNLIFRGTKAEEGLRSDPADALTFEEFDLAANPEKLKESAHSRLGHSRIKREHGLSNPTVPDFGIDAEYQKTDMRRWLLRCANGHYTNPLEDFPKALFESSKDGVFLRCGHPGCDKHLGREGEWVPENPSIKDRRGYQYNQLMSIFHSPEEILRKYRETGDMQRYYNYVLGLGYVEAQNRLSIEQVLAMCGTEGMRYSDRGGCCLGSDQGSTFHAVVGKRDSHMRTVHVGEYLKWDDLDALMDRFRVVRAVVDGQPDLHGSRGFAERWPGKVFRCFYNDHQRGSYRWDEEKRVVTVNRNEALDDSHQTLLRGDEVLPKRCDVMETFALHCHNTAKKVQEDEDGSRYYVWVKLGGGKDHFRHAYLYMHLARGRGSDSYFGDSDVS